MYIFCIDHSKFSLAFYAVGLHDKHLLFLLRGKPPISIIRALQSAISASEVLATAVLLIVVLSVGDKRNSPPPAGLGPLTLFFLILGLGASLGMETGKTIYISIPCEYIPRTHPQLSRLCSQSRS
jgi:hypothetical protein